MASRSYSRKLLNSLYLSLSFAQKRYWHSEYSRLFRELEVDYSPGTWQIIFEGKRVVLPVGGSDMWLKWDAALSILGHEIEIKQAYASLLASKFRPKLFFDVGANYGLHSLLFLVHGIEAMSFEPNVNCHSYFLQIAALNHVASKLCPVAVGAEQTTVDLWFPSTETWLGTTIDSARNSFPRSDTIQVNAVRQITLDQFVEENDLEPDLLKIDTEGGELNVFRGGQKTLKEIRPLIIFESWHNSYRAELFQLLDSLGYHTLSLRYPEDTPRLLGDLEAFLAAPGNNFLGAPAELSSSVLEAL